jgi:hypothetical protein
MLTIAPGRLVVAELPFHQRDLVFHRKEHAEQVDLEDFSRLGRGHLRQLHEGLGNPGIVDGDVEAAKRFLRQRHQVL